MNLMEVDGSGIWNIVGNTYNGDTGSHFRKKYWENDTSLYSPDDALIEILRVFICETWPSIPVVCYLQWEIYKKNIKSNTPELNTEWDQLENNHVWEPPLNDTKDKQTATPWRHASNRIPHCHGNSGW